MSAWNQVLQATHSALIDELNARFPDEILELGLPKRFDGFSALNPGDHVLFREIRTAEGGAGFAALAGAPTQSRDALTEIFAGAHARAKKEFTIREIAATFGPELPLAPATRMTIWLPIAIHRKSASERFDLALGVGV